MKSYIIYKEKIPTGHKSMSTPNYTIEIHDGLCAVVTREEKDNWKIWHKKIQELNALSLSLSLCARACMCVRVCMCVCFFK